MWWVVIDNGLHEIHIIPGGDLIEHIENDECVCGPTTTAIENGKMMITHHSLDGRELNEPQQTD